MVVFTAIFSVSSVKSAGRLLARAAASSVRMRKRIEPSLMTGREEADVVLFYCVQLVLAVM